MKQMIQRMREEKGGFTLAELLVVVAIIAVLVAIAIPVFSAQLDRANAAVDEANIRSGYGWVQSYVLNDKTKDGAYTLLSDGTAKKDAGSGDKTYATKGMSKNCDGNVNESVTIGDKTVKWTAVGQTIVYTVADGKITTIAPAA